MNLSIIVACDQKRGIGINNKLPWNLKADLKHFSEITINPDKQKQNVVVMGRKTWESLPEKFKPLPNRLNVVLSRHDHLNLPQGVLWFESFNHALEALEEKKADLGEIFIIGGGKLYEEMIFHPACRKIYLTEIQDIYHCDTFFPEIPSDFKKIFESKIQEENGVSFKFLIYQN